MGDKAAQAEMAAALSDAQKLALLTEAEGALLDIGGLVDAPSVMSVCDTAVHSEFGAEVMFAAEDSTVKVSAAIERFSDGKWEVIALTSDVPMINFPTQFPAGDRRRQILATGVVKTGAYRMVVRVPQGNVVVSVTPVIVPV